MTLTDEQTAALKQLREPFPKSAVGKLPKGGMQLDYVGHAVVTGRLLAIDPGWTWEPFATDEAGLPILDRGGNLWIRLTICGVTRIGVGDGKSAKECIGDALRNAAMRFGVALDLWSKEELEGEPSPQTGGVGARPETPHTSSTTSGGGATPDAPPPEPDPRDEEPAVVDSAPAGQISQAQQRMIRGMLGKLGVTDGAEQRAAIVLLVGHDFESSTDLTKADASRVIDQLTPLDNGGQLDSILDRLRAAR